jgi:hypothetical protein
MPQRKNLTWGEIPRQRVRRFLEVLLYSRNYDRDLLQIEWQEGQRDRYRLFVHHTTKANLVKLMTKIAYPSEKKKAEIQDAIAHLEELQILTDLRSVKTGAKAENLSFYLDLPSQDPGDILKFILEKQWLKMSPASSESKNHLGDAATTPGETNEAIASSNPDYELTAAIEQQGNQTIVRWQLKLCGNLVNLTPESIDKIKTLVRELTGDKGQNIMNITTGSILIEFAGTEAGFNRIKSQFSRGELTEIAGLKIEAIEEVVEAIDLSQWRRDMFQAGWQAIAALLNSTQMQLAFGWRSAWEPEIIRGKLVKIAAKSLVLVVALAGETETKTRICLQIHPTPQATNLPANLKLILLDQENHPVLTTATENTTSGFLQLDFKGDVGEAFTVNLFLENDIISKSFVI